LLAEVTERQAGWPSPIPFSGDFSLERQKALSNELLAAVGHTDDQCRIDIAPHPFSMVGLPGDVRITTRYDLADFRFAIMATMHEAGHALYESGLPRARAFQPIGAARGATAHESQALMAEMQAGRSPEFLRFLAPRLAAAFGDGECWAYANVLNAFRRLNTGHLRVAADEISYPLHVLLRYRLERALLSGDLEVSELPGAWSDMSQRLLGRAPPRHSLGCLQDMHWAIGMFGYFPNYALGAVLAAQLFERAVGDDPSVSERLAYGDYGPYRDWVRPRIHARGSEVPFSELVEDATGGPLLAAALLRHLKRRYLEEPGPSALS
jgi:carboxypeptidase Taq